MRKFLIKGLVFVLLLVGLIGVINPIFIHKVGHRAKLAQGLYEHPNSFEVVLLGSSHMNSSLDPNVLWQDHGITSFNYGTGGQPLDVTYYLLREVLKYQDPKVVVVDLYYVGLNYPYGTEEYIRYVLDNIRFSPNKVEAVLNCTPEKERINYLFPLAKYHGRWKELTETDFHFDTTSSYYAKGFGAGLEVFGKDNFTDLTVTATAELPEKTEQYLYKIIALAQEEGVQLVFTNAPHDYTSTSHMDTWHKEPTKMWNKVAEIAQANKVPFVNFNNLYEEMGFDFPKDMFNNGHMNIWGSTKVSRYFGDYLARNYELSDYRKDPAHVQWWKDYEAYLEANKLD